MIIHIHISEIEEDMRKLYLEDKVGHLSIDYAYNSIMGWVNNVEVKVFSFDDYFKSDNRYNTYNLYKNKTEIIVEMISTK
jgi:SRSO17 transposase